MNSSHGIKAEAGVEVNESACGSRFARPPLRTPKILLINFCKPKLTLIVIALGKKDSGTALEFIPIVGGGGTFINDIIAFDMDKLSAAIEFTILPTSQPEGFHDKFNITTSSPFNVSSVPDRSVYRASIVQTEAISRHEATRFSLYIVARQVDDINKFRTAELQFHVRPNNENDPSVTTNTGSNTGYIVKNAVGGTYVRGGPANTSALVLVVSDPDVVGSETQDYTYNITSTVPFSIIPMCDDTALVYANHPFDAETQGSYSFTVIVTENIANGRSTTIFLTVVVQDVIIQQTVTEKTTEVTTTPAPASTTTPAPITCFTETCNGTCENLNKKKVCNSDATRGCKIDTDVNGNHTFSCVSTGTCTNSTSSTTNTTCCFTDKCNPFNPSEPQKKSDSGASTVIGGFISISLMMLFIRFL